jgi:glycerate 2-kinase
MNILVSPNSMKGSLSAINFADIVEQAFLAASDDFVVKKIPVADGGDMTGEIITRALNATEISVKVEDPLGRPVTAKYSVAGSTAIIEMAEASGLKLLGEDELNPLKASSYGTGQLIADAIGRGCSNIILGIGGSATVDAGTGMLNALGFKLFDEKGRLLKGNGENLKHIKHIERTGIADGINIKIISDVDNPLTGSQGAAAIFGPQKGATPEMAAALEEGISNWANLLESYCGMSLISLKGAGAAGGISVPLISFYQAEIVPGADFVLSLLNFEDHVKWSDFVITGEGKIDSQTLNNKAPKAVAGVAHRFNKPVVAIGGNVQSEATSAFSGIFSIINEPMAVEEAIMKAPELLHNFAFELAQLLIELKQLNKKNSE